MSEEPRTAEHPGRMLRRLREAAGISLARLATEVHYSKGQLSKIETGQAPLPAALAARCDVLLATGGVLARLPAGRPERARAPLAVRSGLPPATAGFVGREEQLDRVRAFLSRPTDPADDGLSRVCVVHGMPGVGKTALVVRAAYQAAADFADGCLFLDLHGYTQGAAPVTPAAALDRCLRLLDVPAEMIPADLDDRSSLFRDRLRHRRLLLVLDNAVDSAQLWPLLPTVPTCPVLVTSRWRMPALDAADHVAVGPLDPDEAETLFRSVIGRDLAGPGTAETVTRIARRCGLLPLAVRIAAARLRLDADTALADLDQLLHDDRTYLAELDDGDRAAVAVFDTSFDHLTEAHRQLLTTVARHPGPDVTPASAAAMCGCPEPDSRRGLDHLVSAHLLIRRPGGRYSLHDLVRAYANQVVGVPDPLAPLERLMDHYLRRTVACDAAIAPHRYPPAPRHADGGPIEPRSRDDAVRWLADECDNLVAAVPAAIELGLYRQAWQLANALRGYFFLTKDWDRWIDTHRLGIDAARRDGDRVGEGFLLNGLGLAFFERGDVSAAATHYQEALTLFAALDDRFGINSTLGNRAWVHEHRGEHRAALDDFRAALDYYEEIGAEHNIAVTLRGLAVAEIGLGSYADALGHLDAALRSFESLGLPLDQAMTLNCRGDAQLAAGNRADARTAYEAAGRWARDTGSRYEEARAHRGLAATADTDRLRRRHLTTARELYRSLGAPEATEVDP